MSSARSARSSPSAGRAEASSVVVDFSPWIAPLESHERPSSSYVASDHVRPSP